jgi:hypothetical protein
MAVANTSAIGGYNIRFDGRTVAGGQTRFSYTVSGTGTGASLNHFVIELPPCAPALASVTPSSGLVNTDAASGLYGVKWGNLSIGPSESGTFSITFPGDVSEGVVRVALKAGSVSATGAVPGPCQGFTISGTVFVDPDASGNRNADTEPGLLANVTVSIVNSAGAVETALTDVQGRFSVKELPGTYTVRIDAATAASDFNETLASSFLATGGASRSVTLGPDATGVDFGFKPQTRKLLADFDSGALASTGQPSGYWIKALRAGTRGTTYDGWNATNLKALLVQIEGAFLPDPYQFTNGSELQEALAILTTKPGTDIAALYQELLVSELNDASGKGIVGNPALQDVLISWAESIIASSSVSAAAARNGDVTAMGIVGEDVLLAEALMAKMNNSRGGGGIPDP